MRGISVDIFILLINGLPQSLLMVLGLHIFSQTKINIKKYLLLSLISLAVTYLIRFLPITLGVNSVLSLLFMILAFQFAYKTQLSRIIITIASAAASLIMIAISEVLNMLLLSAMYGQKKAVVLFNSSDGLTRSIATIPSTVFLGLLVFLGYLFLKQIKKRKNINGEDRQKIGS